MSLHRLNARGALLFAAIVAGFASGGSSKIMAQAPGTPAGYSSPSSGEMDHDAQIKWGPAPAVFPPGAQFAVLQGDPSVAGAVFTVRLRFPNGYVLPPHTHPTDENVTVIRGTFLVGVGENFSKDALKPLKEGAFISAPANMAHFATARGATEVQVHAIGPFQLTYVHPQDNPQK